MFFPVGTQWPAIHLASSLGGGGGGGACGGGKWKRRTNKHLLQNLQSEILFFKVWSLNHQHHLEACWKCRISGSTSDLLNKKLHFNISRWYASTLKWRNTGLDYSQSHSSAPSATCLSSPDNIFRTKKSSTLSLLRWSSLHAPSWGHFLQQQEEKTFSQEDKPPPWHLITMGCNLSVRRGAKLTYLIFIWSPNPALNSCSREAKPSGQANSKHQADSVDRKSWARMSDCS